MRAEPRAGPGGRARSATVRPGWPTWRPCSSRPAGGWAGPAPWSSSWRRTRRPGPGAGPAMGTTRCGSSRTWRAGPAPWWHCSAARSGTIGTWTPPHRRTTRPDRRWSGGVGRGGGGAGGRCIVPCRTWAATAWPCGPAPSRSEARLVELAADPDGPHYAVGQIDDVRALTSGWTDELGTLLGALLARAGRGVRAVGRVRRRSRSARSRTSGPTDARPAARRLRRRRARVRRLGGRGGHARRAGAAAAVPRAGPWRTVPLRFTEAEEVAHGLSRRRRGARGRRRPSRRARSRRWSTPP